MLAIRNLQSSSLPEVTAAFNDGFSDYFIDVELSPELMAYKIAAEDIDLGISVGAFEEEHLVGLILHGNRQLGTRKIAYNAGTCVRPAFRRRGLVKEMYAHILPELQRQGFSESILEVIDINTPAYLAYEGIGFVKMRVLEVFSGQIPVSGLPAGFSIQALEKLPPTGNLEAFWDYQPTWQHAWATALNTWERQKAIGLWEAAELVGYGIFTSFSGRVLQFAVDPAYRGKGLGKALLSAMQQQSEAPLRFVNVEQMEHGPGEFLRHLGLRKSMGQFEMRLGL